MGAFRQKEMYLFSFFLAQCQTEQFWEKKYLLSNVKDVNPLLVKAVCTHWFGWVSSWRWPGTPGAAETHCTRCHLKSHHTQLCQD